MTDTPTTNKASTPREFGQLFRQEREARGMTQQQLASAIGKRRQAIGDLEAGKNVGMATVFMALAALGEQRAKPALVGLGQLKKNKAHGGLFANLTEHYYEAGISGAQPKVMLPDADTANAQAKSTAQDSDLTVKTGGAQYPYWSQNEYVCMLAAKQAGIEVPEFHLSDDGSLDIQPSDAASVRLAPLFDVVTTSAYDHEEPHSGRLLSDRTLALKRNKSNAYPSRKALLAFGRASCHVAKPEWVIERIAQAMGEVMRAQQSLFPHAFGQRMAREWDEGSTLLL